MNSPDGANLKGSPDRAQDDAESSTLLVFWSYFADIKSSRSHAERCVCFFRRVRVDWERDLERFAVGLDQSPVAETDDTQLDSMFLEHFGSDLRSEVGNKVLTLSWREAKEESASISSGFKRFQAV